MKKILYFFVFAFVISSCSKKTVEADPADQVLGTYKATSFTQTTNGIGLTYDLTSASLKDVVQITFDISKKSASVITINLTFAQKDATTGKTTTSKDSFDSVDLKSPASGVFEIYSGAAKLGTVGNGALTIEDNYSSTDSNGKAVQVKDTYIAKKQ